MARITAAEMDVRVNRVVRLLCNGGSRSDVLQYAASQLVQPTRRLVLADRASVPAAATGIIRACKR